MFILSLAGNSAAGVTDGSDAGTGISWESEFESIQKAVDMADENDERWVSTGTYILRQYIEVGKDIGIYGGFNGTENSRDDRGWDINITILDANSHPHLFFTYSDVTIDAFTLVNANSSAIVTRYFSFERLSALPGL